MKAQRPVLFSSIDGETVIVDVHDISSATPGETKEITVVTMRTGEQFFLDCAIGVITKLMRLE